MTGHWGARQNRTVALVTDDFRVYHRVVPFLESQGLRIVVLKPQQVVPSSVRILIGGPPDDPRSVELRPDLEATLLAAYTHLDRKAGLAGYKRVTFGIDPGKVIGLAVVADGHWLIVGEAHGIPAALARLAAWAEGLAAEHWAVHIGAGAPEVGRELLAKLPRLLPRATVHLVREEATTPWSHVTGSRHTDAAVHIALRSP